ncbi:hypothetical protein [Amphibacillus cookii]|uniref:hypothetical protein n=1 Tax=Amphibacillus cookii TaxID=767787 RepID=UPI0019576A29|nr:hypothetical protein [Amphibacillus cookii]MBM7542168.1 hypothetical protein [Amphibacillus cookii]
MLWIITQNENSLMSVKEVTVKGNYIEGVVGRSFFSEWSKALGKYESSERATEILNEIYMKIEEGKGSSITFTMPEK